MVPSCEGVVEWNRYPDNSGGLCPACIRAGDYALRSMGDTHRMRLDDTDGGSRYTKEIFPPRPPPPPVIPPDPDKWGDIDGSRYGLAALKGVLSDLSAVGSGSPGTSGLGRNNALSSAAHRCGQLVAGGELDHGCARVALRSVAADMGLAESEYGPLITRRMFAGAQNPRSAPPHHNS